MPCVGDTSEMSLGLPVPLPLYLPGPGPGIIRRNCLPASHVHASDVSVWNILRNNIGKDLSKVSMPVQLNEPLNTLQRLCEELEYSALLDAASRNLDPCERLVFGLALFIALTRPPSWNRGCVGQARRSSVCIPWGTSSWWGKRVGGHIPGRPNIKGFKAGANRGL